MTNRVSIIHTDFCYPHSVDLVINKNLWSQGNFEVKNTNGKTMFKIEGSILNFDRKRVIVEDDGTPVVTLRKKMLSFRTTWEVYRGEEKKENDIIFSVRKVSILPMTTKLVVCAAKNKSDDVCNYTVQGSWFERSCNVYKGDSSTLLAQIHKNFSANSLFTGNDRFKVTVYPNVDCAFIVALMVILDEMTSNQTSSSSKK